MSFSSVYRSISRETETDSSPTKESYKRMKNLPIVYNEALKTLNQHDANFLLEEMLKSCKPILQTQSDSGPKIDLNPGIRSIKIGDLLKENCMNGNKIECTSTKETVERHFLEFKKCFQKKTNRDNAAVPTTSGASRKSSLSDLVNMNNVESRKRNNIGIVTAREELNAQNLQKYGTTSNDYAYSYSSRGNVAQKQRKLGLRSRGVNKKFVSPLLSGNESEEINKSEEDWVVSNENLQNIDPKMIEMIRSEIIDTGTSIDWDDIAGLNFAKAAIQESVIWPMLRPDIFTGLRRPPRGILLFGPPGTGKTLIGRCVASQSKSTFFSISASSLTSKWIGDGEKMVRALFAVARSQQPAVIFIDEIDSLLSQRSDTEHESSRRIKTEFLVQLDGASTNSEERVLFFGATNRPQELDEAARRRFAKRLYIPLPEYEARLELLKKLMSGERHSLSQDDFEEIARLSEGYSGADVKGLCSEASLGPIRSISMELIHKIQAEDVRPLMIEDFKSAFQRVKSSVSSEDLKQYVQWNKDFGCGF